MNSYQMVLHGPVETALHSVKLSREPGHDLEYSNAGFSLLGIILERVYGMSYERMVETEIAAPLGMRDTAIVLNPQQTALFASGHADDGTSRPSLLLDVPAAGGLRSNVEDMLLYVRANATASDGAYFDSHQLTSGKPTGGVGLSWDIDKTADGQDRACTTEECPATAPTSQLSRSVISASFWRTQSR